MRANGIRYGSPARAGTYRCADCGHTIRVGAVSSMPPCPRASDEEHALHAWHRQGHGLLLAAALGLVGLGVGAFVYARGAHRVAEDTRELADQGARLSEELARHGRRAARRGLPEAEHGVKRLRRTARSLAS